MLARLMENAQPKKKSSTKRVMLEVAIGLVIGFGLSTFFGPALISWWYKPLSQNAFSCADTVAEALGKFVLFQLGCALAGGILLTVLSLVIRRARAKSKAPT
jgi:hypothetical protein